MGQMIGDLLKQNKKDKKKPIKDIKVEVETIKVEPVKADIMKVKRFYVNIEDAARIANVSVNYIRKMIRSNDIDCYIEKNNEYIKINEIDTKDTEIYCIKQKIYHLKDLIKLKRRLDTIKK